jgi:hypothetical protein
MMHFIKNIKLSSASYYLRFIQKTFPFLFNFNKSINFKKISFLFIPLIIFSGCGPSWSYSDFKNVEGSKSEEAFEKDLETCLEEKIKFSSIIQGREYGFRGEHAPFLGCMRYRGWSPKKSFS